MVLIYRILVLSVCDVGSDMTDTAIDDILFSHGKPLFPEDEDLPRIKAAIQKYVDEQVVAARIEELKKLPITEDEMGWAVGAEIVEDRIKALKGNYENNG